MRLKASTLHCIGKRLMKYVYKNPEKNMLKLVKLGKLVAGKMYPASTFTTPIDVISNKDNTWHDYLFNGLRDIDREQFTNIALTFAIDAGYVGTSTLRSKREELKCNIPWVVLLDPTSACNLKCKGCWAAEYGHKSNLTLDEMRKIVSESKALGTHFFMFTGGEPLVRKNDILKIVSENRDCIFLAFTNGTLVDDKFCEDMKKAGNLALALSIEGTQDTTDARRGDGVYDKVCTAMKLLKKHKCLFGTSVCYTSANYLAVTSDEFYDMEIESGAKFAWYFHYMPIGSNADKSLLLTPSQREYVYRAIREKRSMKNGKPIFTVDFQNDGEFDIDVYDKILTKFKETISNDLNTAMAITMVYDVLKLETSGATKIKLIQKFDEVLALNLVDSKVDDIPKEIKQLAELRWQAKLNKDWMNADILRDEIANKGYVVLDNKDGYKVEKK